MAGSYLARGMLAGLLAALVTFLFAYTVGEPPVDQAIAFEEQTAKAEAAAKEARGEPAAAEEPELVSRKVQSTAGLLTGLVVFGTALGGLFGIANAFAQGRLGRLSPRATAAFLALAGFIVLYLVPQMKYPANPPAVGSPETIGIRTALYFGMMALSLAVAFASLSLGKIFAHRLGAWNGALVGLGVYALAVIVALEALPTIQEVPENFSAQTLWQFRAASIGTQALVWTLIGAFFGLFAERTVARRIAAKPVAA
ncbi:CbtA family protein [Rhodomicrobium lacus]|uniref:CbtA family protein n=1 Tax=Rhodomicrobium lacus TaxID=2498452 RepID=UPI000F8D4621|nr:CbtA family protein [Rhodomicrobium lacus]